MEKHKYYDCIVAWASGETILEKHRSATVWREMNPCENINFNNPDYEWKLKPKIVVGWINIYSYNVCGPTIYNSKSEALGHRAPDAIATIKIEYESPNK